MKQIAIAVSRFFQRRQLYSDTQYEQKPGGKKIQWPLIAISANHGDLALIQFVVNKIKLKNIRQTERQIALFLVAFKECKGCQRHQYLDIYDFLTSKLKDKNPGKKSPLNKEGRTPLHYAANNGNFKLCKLIIEGTANKNPGTIKDIPLYRRNPLIRPIDSAEGSTPLHFAAQNGHLEVCKLIMDNITDKNPANVEGEMPFHFAAKKGQLAVCQFMLENLSDKNPRDRDEVTPLHYAAEHGHVELCKLIMENLVDKNPSCSYNSTPLSLATDNKKSEVCQLFHENGIH